MIFFGLLAHYRLLHRHISVLDGASSQATGFYLPQHLHPFSTIMRPIKCLSVLVASFMALHLGSAMPLSDSLSMFCPQMFEQNAMFDISDSIDIGLGNDESEELTRILGTGTNLVRFNIQQLTE